MAQRNAFRITAGTRLRLLVSGAAVRLIGVIASPAHASKLATTLVLDIKRKGSSDDLRVRAVLVR